ncbi:hypothetical protein L1887_08326 [Cichorium endivia]|nr:hypothetical protein L1887_08326 [Cichorium endivia]
MSAESDVHVTTESHMGIFFHKRVLLAREEKMVIITSASAITIAAFSTVPLTLLKICHPQLEMGLLLLPFY